MASEWVKVELYGANNDGQPRRYTIADGTAVSKGTLLELNDPRTAVIAAADVASKIEAWAGVALEEKNANDGATSISCWTDGVFEAVASGAIGIGNPITGAAGAETNAVTIADSVVGSGANIIGHALETAADGETINVRLRL